MPSIDELMAGLAGGDGTGHREAQQALIAAGEAAVGPLVATLLDEQSPVAWHDAGWILRQIGRPAFDPLVEALAEAPTDETRRRCGWAFVGFGEELVDDYARALSHPSPHVRENAALGLQYRKQAGLPALPALLPLLADPVADVRQRAVWAMAELGDGALPALQAIRADGPGHLRAGALQAIAEVAGDQAFTPEDRSALERLIRIKLRTDRPPAVDECGPCGPWLALPTADQQASSPSWTCRTRALPRCGSASRRSTATGTAWPTTTRGTAACSSRRCSTAGRSSWAPGMPWRA